VSYYDDEATTKLKFFFNDFDLYSPPGYIPVIHIDKDSISYGLGIGMNTCNCLAQNRNKYILFNTDSLAILNGDDKQPFTLKFLSKQSFCLLAENDKIACFEKMKKTKKCLAYSVALKISSEYYVHSLSITDDGFFQLYREGVKSDSIYSVLDTYKRRFLSDIIGLIDFDRDYSVDYSVGGDYTEYDLNLKCKNTNIEVRFFGLNGVSYEMRALLVNLERLSKGEY
jgi:hypothetical protein